MVEPVDPLEDPVLDVVGAPPAAERCVAWLAAAGCTNREIADTLFMSVRSVEGRLPRLRQARHPLPCRAPPVRQPLRRTLSCSLVVGPLETRGPPRVSRDRHSPSLPSCGTELARGREGGHGEAADNPQHDPAHVAQGRADQSPSSPPPARPAMTYTTTGALSFRKYPGQDGPIRLGG